MSSILPASPLPTTAANTRRWTAPAWTREPLLHFVLLGALLFAADHFLFARTDDPRVIVVDAAVDKEARDVFMAARGRAPAPEEMEALRRAWLDNEVLYREGLALRVDRGDTAIRERVIFKALSVVNANVKEPEPEDRQLRAWFEKNRVKYDDPPRYDFQEAVLAGDASEPAVRALVETLKKGNAGDIQAGLRVFKGRPYGNIAQGYGEEFARAFEQATPGEWRAYRTRDGWRAMRLESTQPARPAVYESLRGVVMQDWVDAVMAEWRTAAVRALADKYTVRYEGVAK